MNRRARTRAAGPTATTTRRRSPGTAVVVSVLALSLSLLAGPAAANFASTTHSTQTEQLTDDVEKEWEGLPVHLPAFYGGATGGAPRAVAAADLNGDGQDDLAAVTATSFGFESAWSFPEGVAVMLSAPDGTYQRPAYYPLGSEERSYNGVSYQEHDVGELGAADLVAADVNGDGHQDLVGVNEEGNDTDTNVSVLINAGAGQFTVSPVSYPVGSGPAALATGDVDGDGDADVVTANSAGDDVSVLLNQHGAAAVNGSGLVAGTGHFQQPTGSPYAIDGGSSTPAGVAIADLDGDGNADVITANSGSNDVSVLLGGSGGGLTVASSSPYGVGSGPAGVVAADLEGDGDTDIATANRDADTVSVLLNDGTGALGVEADSPYGVDGNNVNDAKPVAVVAAKLGDGAGSSDNDAHPDLATANRGSDTVSVLLSDGALDDGDTSFALESTTDHPYSVGAGPGSLAAGNFDPPNAVHDHTPLPDPADIDADLVTADTGAETLTALHNQ